ncbi:MAG: hypothetical protein WA865_03760 [Spirulinaceae cyanobacterium]
MKTNWYQKIVTLLLILLLSACAGPTPPLTLAPGKNLVKQAVELQVSLAQKRLSEKLNASSAAWEISKIKIKDLKPLYVNNLATYHLKGTYNLKIKLDDKKVEQDKDDFDLYLQLQREGKTWRLLKRGLEKGETGESKPIWKTYLVR